MTAASDSNSREEAGQAGSIPDRGLAGYGSDRRMCDNGRLLLSAAQREESTQVYAQAINRARGNQAKDARWLGLSRLTLREKLTRYGLHPRQDQG